jgi:hemoglobin
MSEPISAASARRQAFSEGSPVTEEMIHTLVHTFYAKIRKDPALGPIFNRVIAYEAWPAHLEKMCDFWSSVTLMSGRFKGNPMAKHIQVGDIRPTHFARWLHLFADTAREVCPPEAAQVFVEKSEMIAKSLQYGIELHRGGLEAAMRSA